MKAFAALAIIFASSSVSAGTVLWRNIEVGMPMQTVRALYPPTPGIPEQFRDGVLTVYGIDFGKGCPAFANIASDASGLVSGVELIGIRCREEVFAAMKSKYGTPLSEQRYSNGMATSWVKDGLSIHFLFEHDGTFTLTYKPAAKIQL